MYLWKHISGTYKNSIEMTFITISTRTFLKTYAMTRGRSAILITLWIWNKDTYLSSQQHDLLHNNPVPHCKQKMIVTNFQGQKLFDKLPSYWTITKWNQWGWEAISIDNIHSFSFLTITCERKLLTCFLNPAEYFGIIRFPK